LPKRLADPIRRFLRSEFARQGVLVFVSTTMTNLFGYVFHFILSRKLGVEVYGALSALLGGFMIFSVPAAVITTVVVKYAAEFRATGSTGRIRALVRRAATVLGGAAFAAAFLGLALSGTFAAFLHIGDRAAVMLLVIIWCLNLLTPALRGVLQGTEDFVSFSISCVLEAALKTAFAVAFAFAGFGLEGVMLGWLIGTSLALAYTAGVLFGRYRNVAGEPLFLDYRRLLGTSGGVALATLCLTSLGFSDVVIVKHYFPPREAGLYGAASLAGKMLFWLVGFVPTIVLPRATSLAASGRQPLPVLLQAVAVVAVMAGSGLFVFSAFPSFVVGTLAGKSFAAAAPLVFPYGIATVLLAALNSVIFYKMGIHRFDFVAPLAVVAVGEIVAISLFHASLIRVVETLIGGNALGLAAALYRINTPVVSVAKAKAGGAAA
jgi:O-antigen/teichoic acid export membrane protein